MTRLRTLVDLAVMLGVLLAAVPGLSRNAANVETAFIPQKCSTCQGGAPWR